MYRMRQAECLSTRAHPDSRRIDLSRQNGDVTLPAFVEQVLGRKVGESELTELTAQFEAFADDFMRIAGLRG